MPRFTLAVVSVGAVFLVGGCGSDPGAGGDVPTGQPAATATSASEDCPAVSSRPGEMVSVDYADFVQANGIQYLVAESLGGTSAPVTAAQVGPVQFRVRRSFSDLNERTHQMPSAPRNGDAGALPAGTPVYAVKGWSPLCRLAAQRYGSWLVYLATAGHSATAQPRPCAERVNPSPAPT